MQSGQFLLVPSLAKVQLQTPLPDEQSISVGSSPAFGSFLGKSMQKAGVRREVCNRQDLTLRPHKSLSSSPAIATSRYEHPRHRLHAGPMPTLRPLSRLLPSRAGCAR